MRKVTYALTWTVILFLLMSSCTTVPITGRKRIALLPSANLATMAIESYNTLLSKSKLSTDTREVEAVRRVGRRIAASAEAFMNEQGLQSKLKTFKWEFNLIDDMKTINAFCMPGGKVAVYTGILPIAKDETGLAVIMGHEVAHAIAEHGNERMSQLLLVQLGGLALDLALKNKPDETRGLFLLAYGVGAQLGILLPYSRTHESESDHIGLILMSRAGYDPSAAPLFWERMAAISKGKTGPKFLSTHPTPTTRVKKLRQLIPEVRLKYYKRQK